MDKQNLANKLEAVLFASGKEIEIDFLLEKLKVSRADFHSECL